MSPAERAARQMIADKKDQEARDKIYGQSLRMTEDATGIPTDSGIGNKMMKMVREARNREANKNMPAVDAMGNQTGFKNGGYVKAADGCAQRGKTRGKMV